MEHKRCLTANGPSLQKALEGSDFEEAFVLSDYEFDFTNECTIERSLYDFLIKVGFKIDKVGTKYVLCILTNCVAKMRCHLKKRELYKIAAKAFSVSVKAVDVSVSRAIADLTTSQLKRLSELLGIEIVRSDGAVSSGSLLTSLCSVILMKKSHLKNRILFG